MTIHLDRPELAGFVGDEVRAGRFASAAELVEAAVEQLMLYGRANGEVDEETLAAIDEGGADIDRGDTIAADEAFDVLLAKYAT